VLDHLLSLFESRVKHFRQLNQLVDDYKVERNMQRFAEECREITKEF
jgi:uncharacterized protein (UPF0147 family)